MIYVGKTTLFRTKHVEDRSSFVHKPDGFIFLSKRSYGFINCIAVIPRVTRRNDLDIRTNPGPCFHMDLWKSPSTLSLCQDGTGLVVLHKTKPVPSLSR